MTRVFDNGTQGTGCCPICNADKTAIIRPDASKPTEYICSVCGYNESMEAKFPSHNV
jgi:hypothetical protein